MALEKIQVPAQPRTSPSRIELVSVEKSVTTIYHQLPMVVRSQRFPRRLPRQLPSRGILPMWSRVSDISRTRSDLQTSFRFQVPGRYPIRAAAFVSTLGDLGGLRQTPAWPPQRPPALPGCFSPSFPSRVARRRRNVHIVSTLTATGLSRLSTTIIPARLTSDAATEINADTVGLSDITPSLLLRCDPFLL